MQRMPMGSCIKAHIVYEHAFWRSAGFSGECVCEGLPLLTLFDNCDPERDYYALMGFFSSENARIWGERTQEERKNAAIDQVYKLFNVEEARWPKAYVDCNWCQEEWSGGAYTGVMGPGTCTQFGQSLCQPVGRVHWAGTETASEWNGYVEGALQAGERAASEVLQYL
jgi:monoamine oxidase